MCDVTEISLKKDIFDVVICNQVIEHVFDHQKVFNEAYRLLKPGGYFVVSSSFIWPMHDMIQLTIGLKENFGLCFVDHLLYL